MDGPRRWWKAVLQVSPLRYASVEMTTSFESVEMTMKFASGEMTTKFDAGGVPTILDVGSEMRWVTGRHGRLR